MFDHCPPACDVGPVAGAGVPTGENAVELPRAADTGAILPKDGVPPK